MLKVYPRWSAFASNQIPSMRWLARNVLHGFDFRVESERGTKRMVKQ